jgi:hypothetical protein
LDCFLFSAPSSRRNIWLYFHIFAEKILSKHLEVSSHCHQVVIASNPQALYRAACLHLLRELSANVDVNRQLAQKPHEPHSAFVHCAKLQGFCGVLSVSW